MALVLIPLVRIPGLVWLLAQAHWSRVRRAGVDRLASNASRYRLRTPLAGGHELPARVYHHPNGLLACLDWRAG